MEIPQIEENEIIYVDGIKCIVRRLYKSESTLGIGEVVFDQGKPTSHDFDWKEGKWYFPDRPDYGGYVSESDPFLNRLRQS